MVKQKKVKVVTPQEYERRCYIIVKTFQKSINTGIPELDEQLKDFLFNYWMIKHSVKGMTKKNINKLIEDIFCYDEELTTRLDLVHIAKTKSTFEFSKIQDTYEQLHGRKVKDTNSIKINKNYTF